ncbi:MAG: hypothetical protein M3P96_16335 [Actinomycetota bacterium]|nr:hypothetical protein [Actinomycetota bacterium]
MRSAGRSSSPFSPGATAATVYLFLSPAGVPRYLLPAYALLSLPAAVGLLALLACGRRLGTAPPRAAATATALVPLLLLGGWHAGVARKVSVDEGDARATVLDAAGQAREHGIQPPCYVLGARAPAFAYALGCGVAGVGR